MKKVSKTAHLSHGLILRFLKSGKPYKTLPEELGISYSTFRMFCFKHYAIAGDRKSLTRVVTRKALIEKREIEMEYLHKYL